MVSGDGNLGELVGCMVSAIWVQRSLWWEAWIWGEWGTLGTLQFLRNLVTGEHHADTMFSGPLSLGVALPKFLESHLPLKPRIKARWPLKGTLGNPSVWTCVILGWGHGLRTHRNPKAATKASKGKGRWVDPQLHPAWGSPVTQPTGCWMGAPSKLVKLPSTPPFAGGTWSKH
jgi:hypothetical protein